MDTLISVNSEQAIVLLSTSIVALAKRSISTTGRFTVALSGGSTPKLLYQYLISEKLFDKLDLSKIHFYFSDERYVNHADIRSNFALARTNMLNYLNIPTENIFPVNTSYTNSAESAQDYQNTIKDNVKLGKNNIPSFDLIILGMGTDGHTASLFPESELLLTKKQWVAHCYHRESNTERISFTFPLINSAKNVYIMCVGKEKYEILRKIKKSEKNNIVKYPVQYVKPLGNLKWFTDNAAEYGE